MIQYLTFTISRSIVSIKAKQNLLALSTIAVCFVFLTVVNLFLFSPLFIWFFIFIYLLLMKKTWFKWFFFMISICDDYEINLLRRCTKFYLVDLRIKLWRFNVPSPREYVCLDVCNSYFLSCFVCWTSKRNI